jgi:hypothetical protein
MIGDVCAQPVEQHFRDVELGLGKQKREFLATPAGNVVAAAHCFAHQLGETFEHGVSGLVAKGVIDFLEQVEIAHRHRKRRAVARRPRNFLFENGVEIATIWQTGEDVEMGHLGDFVFELLARGYVAQDREPDGMAAEHSAAQRNLAPKPLTVLRLAVPLEKLRPARLRRR